jgi:hypothetical protein
MIGPCTKIFDHNIGVFYIIRIYHPGSRFEIYLYQNIRVEWFVEFQESATFDEQFPFIIALEKIKLIETHPHILIGVIT